MSSLTIRHAVPTDDLARLWPALGRLKLNLEQVIVAVDADRDDALLGGIVCWDGGHELVYVGELTLTESPRKRLVAKRLVQDVLIWARNRGASTLVFNCVSPIFTALCLKAGARLIGQSALLVARLAGESR